MNLGHQNHLLISFAPDDQRLKVALQRLWLKVCIPVLSRYCKDAWRYNTVASMAPYGGTIHTPSLILYIYIRENLLTSHVQQDFFKSTAVDYPQSGWIHSTLPNFWVMLEGFLSKSTIRHYTEKTHHLQLRQNTKSFCVFFRRQQKITHVQFFQVSRLVGPHTQWGPWPNLRPGDFPFHVRMIWGEIITLDGLTQQVAMWVFLATWEM